MHGFWSQLVRISGADDVSGPWYGLWSGFASDLAILAAAITLPWAFLRRHNCQVRGCLRFGRHAWADPADHATRMLCWKHHPGIDHKHITRERLHLYLGQRPGRG